MQKTILVSLVTIGLLASVIGVGTYAYFSDTEVSAGNTLTAGTLNLEFGEPSGVPFAITDMKPSYHKDTGWVKLVFGENPGQLYKRIASVDCKPAEVNEPRDNECNDPNMHPEGYEACINKPMTDQMWFDLSIWTAEGGEVSLIPDETVGLDRVGTNWIYLGTFKPGEVDVKESFHLMDEVTNWAQGQGCTMNEEYMLLQDNAPRQLGCEDAVPGDICVG